MEITVTQEKGRVPVTVLHVSGDVNSNTAGELEQRAQQALTAGAHDVILDLSGVPYMSSAGLRVLNQMFKWLEPESEAQVGSAIAASGSYKSSHFKLVNPSARVREVLSMSGFDMFLDIHKSVPDAVAAF